MASPSASVIVCTYNRSRLLGRLLDSARNLQLGDDDAWELLVVDNNSTDDTRDVVARYETALPIRYVFERRQGKTHALNRAVESATSDFLVFTDDDVTLEPDWLRHYVEASAAHPEAGWFGGRILLDWESARPPWLGEESLSTLSGFLGLYDLGGESRAYEIDDKLPAGASMAARRSLFERIGAYREDLGPRGASLGGTGDDTELVDRARGAGIPGCYVHAAICHHFVPDQRLRLNAFFRYGLGKGANQYRMRVVTSSGSLSRAASQLARSLYQAGKGRWDRVRICALNIGIELGHRRARKESS